MAAFVRLESEGADMGDKRSIRGKWIFSGESLEVEIEDGFVASVSEAAPNEAWLSPGFFDLQLNGYGGIDYSSDFTTGDLEALAANLASRGTTRHLPTVITNPEDRIVRSLKGIAAARKASPRVAEAVPGVHVEGPFISGSEGARGVHDPSHIRPADYEEFLRWQDAAEGLIRIVTLSPEDDRSLDFIRKIVAGGVTAAIGHTFADPGMIGRAVDAGARLSTHLGNGCPALIPRLENLLWSQLGDDRLSASIIADGMHLPPEVLRCFTRSKGLERTILISDAAALAGSEPGLYKWGNMDIEINESGRMNLHGTSNLAGAAFLLDTCVPALNRAAGIPLRDCVKMAAVNPGRLLALAETEEPPKAGDRVNLISFRMRQDGMDVEHTAHGIYHA